MRRASITTFRLACLLAVSSLSFTSPSSVGDGVRWHEGAFDGALARARQDGTLVLVYFWMNGSAYCEKVWSETLCSEAGAAALGDLVCVGADATDPRGAELVARFHVKTLPTMIFVMPDGRPEDAILGYIPTADFVAEVARIRAGSGTVSALRRSAEAAPDDLALRYLLATKLDHVGDRDGHDELVASIKRDDPQGRTAIGAQLALYDTMSSIRAAASDPNDPSTFDLAPMRAHLAHVAPPAAAFEGWNWLRGIEAQRGNRAAARAAAEAAWPFVPPAQLTDWGDEVVWSYWDARDELTSSDESFLLAVAQAGATRALTLLPADPDPPAQAPSTEMTAYVARQLDGLACALYLNDRLDEAVATVRHALELDPGGAEHRAYLELFEAPER